MTNKIQIPKSKIKIFKFQSKYAKEVAKLTQETVRSYISEDFTKDGLKRYLNFHSLSNPNFINMRLKRICYIALLNDEVVGTILGREDRIINLYVLGKYHNQGIGRLLYKKFERKASDNRIKSIKVFSSSFAVEFYKRCGFKKSTGLRFRKNTGVKGQPMQKIL